MRTSHQLQRTVGYVDRQTLNREKYILLYELNKLKGVFIMLILLGIGSIIIGAVLIGLGSSKK